MKIRAQCYTTLVRPIMEYSSPVWDPHLQKDINCLEMVQRRSARFVYQDFSRYSSVSHMLQALEWEPLVLRRAQSRVRMLYKAANGLIAIPIDTYLRSLTSTTRGSELKYFIPFIRFVTMKHSFFPATARLWNGLPPTVTTAPSIETFKNSLQGHPLLQNTTVSCK